MTTLPITLTIAGIAAVINIWLAYRVAQVRHSQKVMIGDGGSEPVIARMRAQANFIEYAPIFLILLALIELARGSEPWLWGLSAAFVVGRLLHPFGMDRKAPNALRMIGIMLTFLSLLIAAVYAISIPYLDSIAPAVTYAERASA